MIVPWISKDPSDARSPVKTVPAVITDVSSATAPKLTVLTGALGVIVGATCTCGSGVRLLFNNAALFIKILSSSVVSTGLISGVAGSSSFFSFITFGISVSKVALIAGVSSFFTCSRRPSNLDNSFFTSTSSPNVLTTSSSGLLSFADASVPGIISFTACEKSSLKSLNNPICIFLHLIFIQRYLP